jgi:N-methylhydantoinase A
MSTSSLRIGIDIGGTFTDFVVYRPRDRSLQTFKLLSTPHDPAEAVLKGLETILTEHHTARAVVIHGSTVATNALLERKGARTALVTTHGFRDVLQIGRQNRPELYDLFADPPSALVPEERRFELGERIDTTGRVLEALDPQELEILAGRIEAERVESVAVCLLFSFLHPQHERAIAERLQRSGCLVSVSSEVLPEFREYERTSTTVVNAYVSPVMQKYLAHLEDSLPAEVRLRVMQSNGGTIRPEQARRFGARCVLSGPAGGVVGCETIARAGVRGKAAARELKLITFDMGGTSTDVSLIDGRRQMTNEAVVSGCPIHLPQLDIHTIGAGGGSIASVDPGGALRVGPESAGADPGPACYGRDDLPTVTDANVVLGRIPPEYFLGGRMPLDAGRAREALTRLGKQLGLDPEQAALGVVAVANAHMERALRVISVERGHDPRDFNLLSFGGAGGLHASELARGLGIPRLLVPPLASTLSAFGMLAAEVVKDYTRTVMLPGDTPLDQLEALLEPLAERGRRDLLEEGVPQADIRLEPALDLRYRGQSYELVVPFHQTVFADFHRLHAHHYGYAKENAPIEVVNLRLQAIGRGHPPPLPHQPPAGPDPGQALLEKRTVVFASGPLETPLFKAEALLPCNRLTGPALVVRADTTLLLGPGEQAEVDAFSNLLVEVGA